MTLPGISLDCPGSTFDYATLLMNFCSTPWMQFLWYCLAVPMISALPGRTFDCDTSWKYFCLLHFLDTLLIVTVLLIPAFPSDHFDCCIPLLNFHLLHHLDVFKSWNSMAVLLIVLLLGSTFVLAVSGNTSVCGSHFCLCHSLAVLLV